MSAHSRLPGVFYAALLALSLVPLGTGELKFHVLSIAAATGGLLLVAFAAIELPGRGTTLAVLAFLGWSATSLAWAPDRYRAVTALLWLVALVLPGLALRAMGAAALPAFARITMLIGLLSLVGGLLQYGGLLPAADWANPIRLAGTFINSNLYASWCVALLLLALGALLDTTLDVASRALAATVLGLAAASLPLTASRGGWLGALAGLLIFAALRVHDRGLERKLVRTTLIAAVVAALVTSTAVLLALSGSRGTRVAERIQHAGTYSVSHRLAIWAGTLDLVRANPLGVGLGGFEAAFPRHRLHSDRFSVNFAHSDVLELIAVLGIPGAMLLTAVLHAAWCASPPLITLCHRPLAAGAVASLAALVIQSTWDFPLRKPTLGLFAAAAIGALSTGRGIRADRPTRAAIAVSCLGILLASAPLLAGEHLRGQAEQLEARRSLAPAERAYRQADRWLWPGDPLLARAAGQMNVTFARIPLLSDRFLQRAEEWLTTAITRAPGDAESHLSLALVLGARGQLGSARQHLLDAAARHPTDGTTLVAASEGLLRSGDVLKAFLLEAAALDTVPVRVPPAALAARARNLNLPAETIALAARAESPRRHELQTELENHGLGLAAALYSARKTTP